MNSSFAPAGLAYALPGKAYAVATGDFDADANEDVAALYLTNFAVPQLAVLKGSPSGHLGSPVIYPVPSASFPNPSLIAADLDGDGRLDLLLLTGDRPAFLFHGLGDGSFSDATFIDLGHVNYAAAVADFNGDGNADLAFTDGATVWFAFGDGKGGFSPAVGVPAGLSVSRLLVGDFNGDGLADVVAINSGSDSITLILGVRTLPFAPGRIFIVGNGIQGTAIGDWNGDGRLDVAVSNQQHGLTILLGVGDGTFLAPTYFATAAQGILLAGSFSGSGHSDLVVIDYYGNLTSFLGDGTGLFTELPFSTGRAPTSSGVVDMNRDGRSDLVGIAGSEVVVVPAQSGALFTEAYGTGVFGGSRVVIGDFDGDGRQDIAVYTLFSVYVLWNDPGGFTVASPLSVQQASSDSIFAAADLNRDGKADLVLSGDGQVWILLAGSGRSFGPPIGYGAGLSPSAIAVADLNGDSVLDLIVANGQSNTVSVLLGTTGATFPTQVSFTVGTNPHSIAVADFNGDSHPDLAVAVDGSISILLGNGSGGFQSITTIASGTSPVSVVAADFDGNGSADLAFTNGHFAPFSLEIFPGDGSGGFKAPSLIPLDTNPGVLLLGDFNRDGFPDLAVGPYYALSGSVRVLINDGTGAFPSVVRYFADIQSNAFAVGDFNNDGLDDLAVAFGSSPGGLVVLRNTNCQTRHLEVVTDVSACDAPGESFPIQPVLRVTDDGGNLIACDGGVVSASIVPGTGGPGGVGAVLGGTTAVAASDGVATFSNLSIDRAGSGYQLKFRHPTAGVALSRTITVGQPPSAVVSGVAGSACPYVSGNTSSVPDAGPGARYLWTIKNGVITAGAGTPNVTYTSGAPGPGQLTAVVTNAQGCSATGTAAFTVGSGGGCAAPVGFFTVTPCRLVDTRSAAGPLGGPALAAKAERTFMVVGNCAIPAGAQAVSVNVTVTQGSTIGDLRLYPGTAFAPSTSVINYRAGQTRANNGVISLGASGDLTVRCDQPGGGTVHFILDVNGYFQ
jgi:hypothetical protein